MRSAFIPVLLSLIPFWERGPRQSLEAGRENVGDVE